MKKVRIHLTRDNINGFTDKEIHQFVKIPAPVTHLACDPELQNLDELFHKHCTLSVTEEQAQEKKESMHNENFNLSDPTKNRRDPSFKLGGVLVNAKSIMAAEKDEALPSDPAKRQKCIPEVRLKPTNFDVFGEIEDDAKLLQGICQLSIGSWATSTKVVEVKPTSTKEIIDIVLNPGDENGVPIAASNNTLVAPPKRELMQLKVKPEGVGERNVPDEDALDKEEEKSKKKKKVTGPVPFTTNSEPQAHKIIGDMESSILSECKEKLRPVRKALKALENPDQSLTDEEQVNCMSQCLLEIGEQINKCLSEYDDPKKFREWRTNLWYFVSKFTELHGDKLFNLYKRVVRRHRSKKGVPKKNTNIEVLETKGKDVCWIKHYRIPRKRRREVEMDVEELLLPSPAKIPRFDGEPKSRDKEGNYDKKRNKKSSNDRSMRDQDQNKESGRIVKYNESSLTPSSCQQSMRDGNTAATTRLNVVQRPYVPRQTFCAEATKHSRLQQNAAGGTRWSSGQPTNRFHQGSYGCYDRPFSSGPLYAPSSMQQSFYEGHQEHPVRIGGPASGFPDWPANNVRDFRRANNSTSIELLIRAFILLKLH